MSEANLGVISLLKSSMARELFFFFFIRVISLKNAKRSQVHMEYTREAAKNEKKKEQGIH
jgi:hypothetical protein